MGGSSYWALFSVEQHLLAYSTKVLGYMLKNAGIEKSRAMYVNENANGRATLVCGLCALLAFIKALYSVWLANLRTGRLSLNKVTSLVLMLIF